MVHARPRWSRDGRVNGSERQGKTTDTGIRCRANKRRKNRVRIERIKRKRYDSRTDNTDRDAEGTAAERWILLPDVQGEADCAAVSEPKRACEDRGGAGEPRAVHRTV